MATTGTITSAVIEPAGLQAIIEALAGDGYRVVGPTLRDGAVVYDDIDSTADLPIGWTDEQDGGTYRLQRRDDDAYFGFAVGPHSWKQYLFPSRATVFTATRDGDGRGFEVKEPEPPPRYAFLGVRACEMHAIDIQDRVFLRSGPTEPLYRAAREGAFLVALNCGSPAGTCFCVSMGTGPRVPPGFDLALTELLDDGRHDFLVEAGTERGAELLSRLPRRPAEPPDVDAADAVVEHTAANMGRSMPTEGIRDLLAETLEHPRWDDVAERCLSCTNCTLVCPTCFCSSVEDVSDLTGNETERVRRWASCFELDHSYLHGGSVRDTTRSRYRQWLTHKLGTWIDQYGKSGCVGCGRCISWCPVAIDITEEVRALRVPAEAVIV